jgi:hypothetical protein
MSFLSNNFHKTAKATRVSNLAKVKRSGTTTRLRLEKAETEPLTRSQILFLKEMEAMSLEIN